MIDSLGDVGATLKDAIPAVASARWREAAQQVFRGGSLAGDRDLAGPLCEVRLRLGGVPVPIIPPFSDVLLDHIATRSNRTTATNRASTLLFPGRRADQPIHPGSLRLRLHRLDIPNLDGRTRAIRDLLQQAPPAVIASMLGYCPTSIETIAAQSAASWQRYAAADRPRRS